jgi:prolyl-tRNA synthetase
MGPRDLEKGTVELARRDILTKEVVDFEGIENYIPELLDKIQKEIYNKALTFREKNTREVNSWDEFKEEIEKGGFIKAHWDGTEETEMKIKEETKATIRCIPFDQPEEDGKCVYSGKNSDKRVLFARAY